MKKKLFIFYIFYLWLKTFFGLIFYPFRFTRKISRNSALLPILFSPLLGLFILFLSGRIATILIRLYGYNREVVAIFLSSVLISMILWQLLLLYLVISFLNVFWRKSRKLEA